MLAVYIILLCVGAALVCTMLRVHRPEIATMISLAVGIGVLLLTGDGFSDAAESIRHFMDLADIQPAGTQIMLKAAGLTILCELGVQICCDAGESALAGRIRLACRMTMLGMAAPFILEIIETVSVFSA